MSAAGAKAQGIEHTDASDTPVVTVRHWDRAADYGPLCDWWRAHDTEPVPSAILPDCGLIVEVDGRAAAAAWVYQDNSCGVCSVGWELSNPFAPLFVRGLAVQALPAAVEAVARSQGRVGVFFVTGHLSLMRKLAREGWSEQHAGSEFWKVIMPDKNENTSGKDGVG